MGEYQACHAGLHGDCAGLVTGGVAALDVRGLPRSSGLVGNRTASPGRRQPSYDNDCLSAVTVSRSVNAAAPRLTPSIAMLSTCMPPMPAVISGAT
jgi:hypothetical protein